MIIWPAMWFGMRVRIVAIVVLFAALCAAEEWSRFRGPNGSGISADTGLPVEFGKEEHLVWPTPVRPGKSSPVLTDRHVLLTGAEAGKLYTQCFDRSTGKLLWERAIDQPREEQVNALNHPAALSPVTAGGRVFSFFKDFGLAAYDLKGKQLWTAPLGPYTVSMGLGASPVVAEGSVVVLADQLEGSFIAGF